VAMAAPVLRREEAGGGAIANHAQADAHGGVSLARTDWAAMIRPMLIHSEEWTISICGRLRP